MTPQLSKFTLVAHITFSVGWIGAVAAFLVLSIAGLTSNNAEIVRGAYVSMNLLGLYIIVPLSLASLLTGLLQSLGTSWGLFRRYWTVVKFVLTLGSTFLLLMHQYMAVARAAQWVLASAVGTMPDLGQTGRELLVKAVLAILVLLFTTALSIYKPWGFTEYGRRIMQRPQLQINAEASALSAAVGSEIADSQKAPAGLRMFLVVTAVVVAALVILSHLTWHAWMSLRFWQVGSHLKRHTVLIPIAGIAMGFFFLWLAVLARRSVSRGNRRKRPVARIPGCDRFPLGSPTTR